jgi:hypothetical protein
MAIISETAEIEIKALLASWWTAVHLQLAAATGNEIQIGKDVPLELLFASEIGQCLVRIAEAAENQATRSPEKAQSVLADCDTFEAWLNQTPVAHHTKVLEYPIGYIVLQNAYGRPGPVDILKDGWVERVVLSSLSQQISAAR